MRYMGHLMFDVGKLLPNVSFTAKEQINDSICIEWKVCYTNLKGVTIINAYKEITPQQVANEIIRQAQITLKDIMTNNLQ